MPDDPPDDLADRVAALHARLVARGETLATAESLTGGGLAELVSATPGASASYRGGVVSYATEVKVAVLGVPADLIAEHGVVSAACAEAMADGVRRLLGATWAVSTTGVAGPTEQEGQPVGTVHVAVAGPDGPPRSHLLHVPGDRSGVRRGVCERAIDLLLAEVPGDG